MSDIKDTAQRGDCEVFLIGETPYDKGQKPCPECGSLRRIYNMHLSDELRIYEQIGMKQKRQGVKKPVLEHLSGDDYTKSTGKYNKKVRIIDRENDRYFECVKNADTGEVMHLRDEELSEHYGKGSAKLQKHNFPHEHVAKAAYFIWDKDGRPDGRDKIHWDMAIEDLRRAAVGVKSLYSQPELT